MLTTVPGPDVAAIHDRPIVVLRPQDRGRWLNLTRPECELLKPLPEAPRWWNRSARAAVDAKTAHPPQQHQHLNHPLIPTLQNLCLYLPRSALGYTGRRAGEVGPALVVEEGRAPSSSGFVYGLPPATGEAGVLVEPTSRFSPYRASDVPVRHTGCRKAPRRRSRVSPTRTRPRGAGGRRGIGLAWQVRAAVLAECLVPQGGVQDAFLRKSRAIGPTNPAPQRGPARAKTAERGAGRCHILKLYEAASSAPSERPDQPGSLWDRGTKSRARVAVRRQAMKVGKDTSRRFVRYRTMCSTWIGIVLRLHDRHLKLPTGAN
jgi:hypothetical protein